MCLLLEILPFFSQKTCSVHVRRRALLALRALSKEQPDLIKPVIPKVQKRLEDSETAVVSAALIVVTDLVKASFAFELAFEWFFNGFSRLKYLRAVYQLN